MKLLTIYLITAYFFSGLLHGAPKTWSSSASTSWNTNANWTPSGAPGTGDDLTFPSGGTVSLAMTNNLSASTILRSLLFSGNNYSLSGSTVRLQPASSGGTTLQGSFTTQASITAPIQLEDSQRFVHLNTGLVLFGNQVSLGSHGLTFSGPVNSIWEFGPGSSLSGSGPIGVASQGTLWLKTSNPSYSGDITVEDASLNVENAGALGPGGITNIRSSTTTADGDVLLRGTTPMNVVENFDMENGTLLRASAAAHKISGSVVLGSGASVCSLGTFFNGSLEIEGVISGPGSLSANQLTTSPGALGKLILSGSSANIYAGSTTILTGEMHLGKTAGVNAVPGNLTIGSVFTGFTPCTAKLLNDQQIPDTAAVSVGDMGTFNLNGRNETIHSLSLDDCEVVMGAGRLTLAAGLSTNTSAAFGSFIRGTELILSATSSSWNVQVGTTVTALTVESKVRSAGTLSRSNGTGNLVFSGETDLAAVTLSTNATTYFNGPVSNPASRGTVTVRSNATLAGSGQTGNILCDAVSISKIAPGGPGGRVLNSGNVTLNGTSKLQLDVGVSAQDRLDASGTVALGNAALELTLEPGFSATYPQSFTIVSNDGSDAVTGTFAGLPEGTVFVQGGQSFIITYQGGDGNDVVLGGVPPVFSISTAPGETVEGGSIDFTITMTGTTNGPITLQYTTVAGTAVAPGDFIAKSGQLVFGPAATAPQTVTVTTVNDNVDEGTQTFQMTLNNLGGGLPGTTTATASIADNDPTPVLTLTPPGPSLGEGAGNVSFSLTLDRPSELAPSVSYQISPGSAANPGDFTGPLSGSIVFAAGQTSATVNLAIINDNIFETAESFTYQFTNATPPVLSFGGTSGTITIADDDTAPDPVPGFHVAETTFVPGNGVTPPSLSGSLKGGPPNGVAAAEISSDLGVTDPWTAIDCVAFDANGDATIANLAAPANRIGAPRLFFRFRVADILLDQYDDDGGFHPTDNTIAAGSDNSGPFHLRSAVSFTVPPGDSRRFVSLTAPIMQQSNMGSNLRITLRTNVGGSPGGVIEVLSENEPLPAFANPFTTSTRFCPPSFPVLAAGTTYWIVCEPIAVAGAGQFSDYRWFLNETPGRTMMLKQQSTFGSGLPANPWPAGSFSINVALKIETLPVP